MNGPYFIGIDIVEETKTLVDFTISTCTNGMTDGELMAYKLGIKNTVSALKAVLTDEDMIAVNIPGLDIPTELDIYEIEQYCSTLQ